MMVMPYGMCDFQWAQSSRFACGRSGAAGLANGLKYTSSPSVLLTQTVEDRRGARRKRRRPGVIAILSKRFGLEMVFRNGSNGEIYSGHKWMVRLVVKESR
jgi:Cu2+-containing amine oxidase